MGVKTRSELTDYSVGMNASALVLDLRTMPARVRYSEVFRLWSALEEGETLLVIEDHDPLALYYQFAAEKKGKFHWTYDATGPVEWRVLLAKGVFPDPGFMPHAGGRHMYRRGLTLRPVRNYQEIMRKARRSGLVADLHLPLEGGEESSSH